jgi:hypothetical protein
MTEQHSLDPKQVRRHVYSAIHSLDRMSGTAAYYQVGAVVHEMGQILDEAWTLIEADDGNKQSPSWTEAKPHTTLRQAIG